MTIFYWRSEALCCFLISCNLKYQFLMNIIYKRPHKLTNVMKIPFLFVETYRRFIPYGTVHKIRGTKTFFICFSSRKKNKFLNIFFFSCCSFSLLLLLLPLPTKKKNKKPTINKGTETTEKNKVDGKGNFG